MKNRNTPKPGSSPYPTERPQDLNIPEYHSSSDRRASHELPAIENVNDQADDKEPDTLRQHSPKPDLGNPQSKNEGGREKLITK
mgnify:CR=1 FL=1